jgi:hypothetical protein
MLNFEPCDINAWKWERALQPYKLSNAKYLEILSQKIEKSLTRDITKNGHIVYANGDSVKKFKDKCLYYNYGSPIPYLCKLLPDGYGFTHHEPNDIWKKCHIEIGIHKKLKLIYDKGFTTRYKQPPIKKENVQKLPENYILIVMQNVGSTVWYKKNFTDLAEQMISWSRENKKNILFKWHNGCLDHSNPKLWFENLKEKSSYAYLDYKVPLPYLIKNCEMLWTASSMSGIEALIYNKPVSTFGMVEYSEMSKLCESVEDAYSTKLPKPEDLERWMTYYVRKYCINIYDSNCIDRIHTRIFNFFEKDLSIDEIILL